MLRLILRLGPCFYGFAKADIIGNEQIDARQQQRLTERLELIRIQSNPRPKGRLKQPGVCGSDTVPAEGVEVG
jgi:hypothetical protein